MSKKEKIVLNTVKPVRDFIFIEDVVEAWLRAGTITGTENLTVNLGAGTKTTVEQLLCTMKSYISEMTWYVEGATEGDQFGVSFNNTQLKKMLGSYELNSLEKGLGIFIDWARNSRT